MTEKECEYCEGTGECLECFGSDPECEACGGADCCPDCDGSGTIYCEECE